MGRLWADGSERFKRETGFKNNSQPCNFCSRQQQWNNISIRNKWRKNTHLHFKAERKCRREEVALEFLVSHHALFFPVFGFFLHHLLANSIHDSDSVSQCCWDTMPWSSLRHSVAPAAATLFFFSFKTLYRKPLGCILHLPASQMAPFSNYPVSFSKEAYIFSGTFSSYSLMHRSWAKLLWGCGKLQSITIVTPVDQWSWGD